MGWKGTVRSIGAAVRAAERDAKRRQRELERRQKQYAKMQELEQAAYDVEVYENHIELIQSVHKECSETIRWGKIAKTPEPKQPVNLNNLEKTARKIAESYKPGFLDRLFKREDKQRKKLDENITRAIKNDDKEYLANLSSWKEESDDWKESVELANLILMGDQKAKIRAIENLDPFAEISTIGSSLSISISDKGLVEAEIHIHGDDIVPSEAKSLLKSGKLSIKKMPKGQFNEIYQDYVCSSVMRVANELFSVIPDDMVVVTAVDELLNTKTGHQEKSPILSVCFSRQTLKSLNMNKIDPSDSMSNFIHNMTFIKNKGFDAVSHLNPELLESAHDKETN
jgi:hypothetical protein